MCLEVPILGKTVISADETALDLVQNAVYEVMASVSQAAQDIIGTTAQVETVSQLLQQLTKDTSQVSLETASLGGELLMTLNERLTKANSLSTVRKFSEKACAAIVDSSSNLLSLLVDQENITDLVRIVVQESSLTLRSALLDTIPGQEGFKYEGSSSTAKSRGFIICVQHRFRSTLPR